MIKDNNNFTVLLKIIYLKFILIKDLVKMLINDLQLFIKPPSRESPLNMTRKVNRWPKRVLIL